MFHYTLSGDLFLWLIFKTKAYFPGLSFSLTLCVGICATEKKKKTLCLHELNLNRRPSSAALHNILGASQNFLLVQPDFLFLVVPQYVTPAKSHQHIQLNISEASTLCKFYYLEALSNVFTPRERVKVWVSSSILSVLNWGTNSLLHTNVIFLLTDLQASSKYMPGLFSILKTQDRRQYFKKSF